MNSPTVLRPPGPRGRWLVGNSYDYDQDRIGFLQRNLAQYGDVFSFSPNTIFVNDPDLIHEVLTRSNDTFAADAPLFTNERDRQYLEDRLDNWMRSRRLAWRGMTRSIIRQHGLRIIATFDSLLRSLAGTEIDVVSVARGYSSTMVADFLFGPGSEDIVDATDTRSRLAISFMNTNLTFPKWLPLPSVRRALRAEDRVVEAITAHIRNRIATPHKEPEDLLDVFLAEKENPPTETEIEELLAASMLASFGSPGAALSWVIYEMSAHREITARLRAEANETLAAHGSLVDPRYLPYADAFVKEILRLYPPTWLMGRAVRRECVLGDWTLTPGHEVMFSPYLVQRDPRWWQQPEEFRPERWLESPTPATTARAYFPFGAGPRVCLGMHLGIYQLVTAAAHLAAHYRISAAVADTPKVPYAVLLPGGLRARIDPLDADARPHDAEEVAS